MNVEDMTPQQLSDYTLKVGNALGDLLPRDAEFVLIIAKPNGIAAGASCVRSQTVEEFITNYARGMKRVRAEKN